MSVAPDDLRSYLRLGDLAQVVKHHDPTEYWKSAPYLVNFMEHYKLKKAIEREATAGQLGDGEWLDPGPGLLSWADVENYERVDPQNGRLRWLVDDLQGCRAFDLLWIPPSLRYYDTGSVYESAEAVRFTKRLIFSAGGSCRRSCRRWSVSNPSATPTPTESTVTRPSTEGVVASGSRSTPASDQAPILAPG